MKKALLIVCIVVMCFTLAGCGTTVERQTQAPNEAKSMFVIVEDAIQWSVVYDRETKVMYVVSCGTYNRGTFTLLVNTDGTPKLWGGGK